MVRVGVVIAYSSEFLHTFWSAAGERARAPSRSTWRSARN